MKSPSSFLRNAAWFAAVLIGFSIISGSWFKVEPTERGNVRRFGVVQHDKPLQPGLHFKLPLIDDADKLQVSLTTVHIPPFDVTTVDNQKVTLEINFNYTIPDEKVNHVMYEIGRSGNTDIDSQVVPVVKDRTGRIFSAQNMVSVNASRAAIQPHSLQIAAITPSSAFMASNEEAVKAKNAAVAAENTKKTKQFEADQLVIKAKGDADSAIEAARGRSESMLLLEGEAGLTAGSGNQALWNAGAVHRLPQGESAVELERAAAADRGRCWQFRQPDHPGAAANAGCRAAGKSGRKITITQVVTYKS
ncbi:MAG: SPFH domain-containing protein [Candidatus Electronema sp. VV]